MYTGEGGISTTLSPLAGVAISSDQVGRVYFPKQKGFFFPKQKRVCFPKQKRVCFQSRNGLFSKAETSPKKNRRKPYFCSVADTILRSILD